jgi:high-affinity nickel-transport protein
MKSLIQSSAGQSLLTLTGANLAAWLWAFHAFANRPDLLGSALLAWLFGLRHAVDADHLAAIDNVVRKLMQQGQRPSLAGLYFSLGHASVVILAATVIACTASASALIGIRQAGGIIGTLVSGGFLLLIALINLRTLIALLRGTDDVAPSGLLARILGPAIRLVRRSAHMYPLGFLFGLGFDTATEVGLLALAATQAASGVSFAQVMIFPALFTAGMALIDTADSVLMVRAYGWAFIDAGRKRLYNITVTLLSITIALAIGGLETIGLVADQLGLERISTWVSNTALNQSGFAILALFVCTWGLFAVINKRRAQPVCDIPPAGQQG